MDDSHFTIAYKNAYKQNVFEFINELLSFAYENELYTLLQTTRIRYKNSFISSLFIFQNTFKIDMCMHIFHISMCVYTISGVV